MARKKDGVTVRSSNGETVTMSLEAYRAGARSNRAIDRTALVECELSDLYNGVDDDQTRYVTEINRMLKPQNLRDCQQAAREWLKTPLLGTLVGLKRSMWNYGFSLKPVEELNKKEQGQFEEWQRKRMRPILAMMRALWTDRLIMDGCIAFWRSKSYPDGARSLAKTVAPVVVVLKPENCRYSDALGLESLRVKMDLSREDLKGFSQEVIERYSKGEVELSEKYGEHYRVLKTERLGDGFGRPAVEAIFEALTTEQGLQFADRCWALFSQTVIRQWKVGHEIRNGPYAGLGHHFMKPEDSAALKRAIKGKRGCVDLTTNFDREVDYPFPTLDRFDAKKYEGSWKRLAQWSGALGMLFMGGANLQPEVLQRLMFSEASEARAEMKLFVEEIVAEVFAPPVELEVNWGDEIFTDTRMFTELVKALLAQGL
jgi:hypothetical protein